MNTGRTCKLNTERPGRKEGRGKEGKDLVWPNPKVFLMLMYIMNYFLNIKLLFLFALL